MWLKDGGVWVETGRRLIMDRQEPLRLPGRLEPAHDLSSWSRGSVRGFCTIAQSLVLTVLDARGNLRFRCTAGAQLVGDHHPWLAPGLEQLSEKRLCRHRVSTGLNQNLQNVPIGADGTPEPMFAPIGEHYNVVEVPLVCGLLTIPTVLRDKLNT